MNNVEKPPELTGKENKFKYAETWYHNIIHAFNVWKAIKTVNEKLVF